MPRPGPDATRLAGRYHLDLSQSPTRGGLGTRTGQGVGASLEFQDRRSYVPGDSLRHLDWRAYARTDQLLVRLYREEIFPRVEILLDGSRSMRSDPEKAQRATDLVAVLSAAAGASGCQVQRILLEGRPRKVSGQEFDTLGVEFDAAFDMVDLAALAGPLLGAGALRLLVSDFLFPHDPARLLRPVAMRAGGLVVLQLLSPEDAVPAVGASHRLVDAETGEHVDLVCDARTVSAYQLRLQRLCRALQQECQRLAGSFFPLNSAQSLDEMCRRPLAAEGLLVPR